MFGTLTVLIISLCLDLSIAGFRDKVRDALGCIKLSDDSCDFELMTFWYYNNENTAGIQIDIAAAKQLPIYPNAPWKILWHGFSCNRDITPNPQLREAYFKRGKYNIISADNEKPIAPGVQMLCYPRAAKNTATIGKCSAFFLSRLINSTVLPNTDKLHFIGHSLGAHIAGNTGHHIKLLGFGKVSRITGLDPAGPLLENDDVHAVRILDRADGKFVDSHRSHTKGAFSKGQKHEVGHVDTLYNDGKQPGCDDEAGCSHRKAVEYFAESIFPIPPQNLKFYAWKKFEADNRLYLIGEDADTTLKGCLHIYTKEKPPYALGYVRPPARKLKPK